MWRDEGAACYVTRTLALDSAQGVLVMRMQLACECIDTIPH